MAWWVIPLIILASSAVSYTVTALTAKDYETKNEANKLDDLTVQTSTYGAMIHILYGTMRFAGNIIWSTDLKEHKTVTTETSGGGKGGGGGQSVVKTTTYTYTCSFAIGICAGTIDRISRIWADTKEITIDNNYCRLYTGNETQNPDPLIQGIEGIGKTPAYRGLAYIVIQDFLLTDYANRIPNFTFEVVRNIFQEDVIQDKIKEMVCIPGSGEFVYDTDSNYYCTSYFNHNQTKLIASGKKTSANITSISQKSDSIIAMEHLKTTCKNVNWIAPVVN